MLLITALSFLVCLFVHLFFTVRGRSALNSIHDPHTFTVENWARKWRLKGSFDKGGRRVYRNDSNYSNRPIIITPPFSRKND